MHRLDLKSAASQVMTFQDLFDLADSDPTLSKHVRIKRRTAVRTLARVIAYNTQAGPLPLSAIRCDIACLCEQLFREPPKAHGLKKGSFGNAVGALRTMLRELGLLDPRSLRPGPNSPWQPMLASLKHANCLPGLQLFAAWCEGEGVTPEAVTDETLVGFEHYLRTRHLRSDIPRDIGTLVKNWRTATVFSDVWPVQTLKARQRGRRYRFSFEDFPSSVQDTVAALKRRLAGEGRPGPFSGDGTPFGPLMPNSIKRHEHALKRALNAYVEVRGITPAQVTDLAQLLKADAMEEILTLLWREAVQRRIATGDLAATDRPASDAGNTSYTAAVANVLVLLARHIYRRPESDLLVLKNLAARIRPKPQAEIGRRNTAILDKMLEPKNRLAIARLPATLMAMADGLTDPEKAAWTAMMAVAIEIELNKPLRLMNLTRLRLGEEVQFTDPRLRRPTKFCIPARMVKNGVDIKWPISEPLGELIAHYLRHHRPKMPGADTPWLFPGRCPDGSRNPCSMRAGLQTVIAEHVGVRIHPHIFRAFVCYLVIEANPGALEDLRQVLDHKTLETSLRYYAHRRREEVASRVDQVLLANKAGSFLKPVPKTPGGGRRRR